jgi:hypothetical protein
MPVQKSRLDPDVADTARSVSVLTVYDEQHVVTYLRLLDADAKGADWREVARIVLHLDPERESDRARRTFDSHLSRAKWMMEHGTGTCYVVARRLKALTIRPRVIGYWPQKRTALRGRLVGCIYWRHFAIKPILLVG